MHAQRLMVCKCGTLFVLTPGKPGYWYECQACGEQTELERGVIRVEPAESVMASLGDLDLSEVLR